MSVFSFIYIRWNGKKVVPLQPETPFCEGAIGVTD
jgi:hypothetical protein